MSVVEHVKITTINNESLESILDGVNSTRFKAGDSLINVTVDESQSSLNLIYDGFTVDEPDFHIQINSDSKCLNYELSSEEVIDLLSEDSKDAYEELWNYLEYHSSVDFN